MTGERSPPKVAVDTGLPVVDRIIEETIEAIRQASRREIASALRRVADGLEKSEAPAGEGGT